MSDSNRMALGYAREAAYNAAIPAITAAGVQGTTALFNLRFTKEALDGEKDTITSEEIRSDRMVSSLIQVGQKGTGNFECEFTLQDLDDLIAAALFADAGTTVSGTGTFATAGQTFTAASGTPFAALAATNPKHVVIAGSATAGNNGIKTVISMTSTVITFATGSVTGNESAGPTITTAVNYVTATDAVTVTVAGQVMTATSGAYSAAVQSARYVRLANMATAGNNGVKKVVSCTATVLTLATGSLSGSDTGDACTVQCNYIRTGVTYYSHILQKEFLDVPHYMLFTGMGIDTFDLKLDAQKQAMATFAFMGYKGQSRTATVNNLAKIAASSNVALNSASNIGTLTKDGSNSLNPVKSISLKVANNLRSRPVIGDLGSAQHGVGASTITGQVDVYFNNKELLDAYLTHTAFALEFLCTDSAGNISNCYLPSVQASKGTPMGPGLNADVMQSLPFTAFYNATAGYQMQVDRLLA